jgi:hypothetical protein
VVNTEVATIIIWLVFIKNWTQINKNERFHCEIIINNENKK